MIFVNNLACLDSIRYIYALFQIKMDSIATFEGFLKGIIVLFC
jgi:hypothetical protein